jgi:transitional endoplasmic reticulum ATPase
MDLINDPDFLAGLEQSLRGDYAAAITSFEAAAVRFPDAPEVHYEVGLSYQRRAEASLPAAMRYTDPGTQPPDPGLAASVTGLVNAFVSLAVVGVAKVAGQTNWIVQYRDDFRSSAAAFERTIIIDPKYAPAYYALAQTLRYLGQDEAASQQARKASELEPGNRHYQSRSETIDTLRVNASAEESNKVTWNDVVLTDRTKRELRQMQLLLERPSLSRDLGIEPPTGLLLYGPPGTGKTTIARVLAHESKCRFFSTSPAQVNSMWLGESEKQVARLFAQARANAPSIVFLDEIDALLPSRSGGVNMYSDKVVNQFLHEMDGMTRNVRVFVIGATNRRDMLDPALLRGGRLSREIEIPLPDLAARRALFALSTRTTKLASDVDIEVLAERTEGHSGANIKALVNEAGMQALIRLSEENTPVETERSLSWRDFEEALANFKPQNDDPPQNPWRMFG